MPDSQVLVRQSGGVAVISLNEPVRRNVLSASLVRAIGDALDDAERSDSVRCVVITGEGRAFCAGAELDTLRAAADGDFAGVEDVYSGFLRVLRSPLPTIAAVNGPAVGAGFNLALACDVRLAAREAVFDTRFARLHIHPGGGHAWLLARAVGQQRAMLACLFGEVWDAAAALDAGLVAAVHEGPDLLDAAIKLGRRLEGQEPDYVRRLVQTLRQALTMTEHSEALAHETRAQQWSLTRPVFLEGVRAIEETIAKSRANRPD